MPIVLMLINVAVAILSSILAVAFGAGSKPGEFGLPAWGTPLGVLIALAFLARRKLENITFTGINLGLSALSIAVLIFASPEISSQWHVPLIVSAVVGIWIGLPDWRKGRVVTAGEQDNED